MSPEKLMSKKICFSPWVKKNLGEFLNNNYEDNNIDYHNCCLGDYNSNYASNYQIIVSGCQKGMDVIYLTEAQISDLFKKKRKIKIYSKCLRIIITKQIVIPKLNQE